MFCVDLLIVVLYGYCYFMKLSIPLPHVHQSRQKEAKQGGQNLLPVQPRSDFQVRKQGQTKNHTLSRIRPLDG